MFAILTGKPSEAGTTDARATIGGLYTYIHPNFGPQILRYVQLHGTLAATANSVASIANQTADTSGPSGNYALSIGTVTVDRSDDGLLAAALNFGGVFQGACAVSSYAYVVVNGACIAQTDGGVAIGEKLVVGAALDHEFDTMAAGEEHHVVATALTADGATVNGSSLDADQALVMVNGGM